MDSMWSSPTPAIAAAVCAAAAGDAVTWAAVRGGYTRQQTWIVSFADGSSAFVKAADDEPYLGALRREVRVYESVDAPFLPRFIGAWDDGHIVALVVEDLSRAAWPPPYPTDVVPLFEALAAVAETTVPAGVLLWSDRAPDWRRVVEDPAPFLELGLCSAAWFEATSASLVEAESRVSWAGDDFVHYDVYSGNVCFVDGRVLLVDWDTAGLGNRYVDVAFALLSVLVEGATVSGIVLPQEGDYAALLSGHLAVSAPAPVPDWAAGSGLREAMIGDLRHALGWTATALGLQTPEAHAGGSQTGSTT